MDTKWLEDFITLAETRSFSRAAELRNVTQPAFSRRIQALEAWVATALVDRTTYPTRLTAAGETFHAQALAMLSQLSETRALLRGHERQDAGIVDIAMPHTLALTFFPPWLKELEASTGALDTRVTALNVHDAVIRLVDGGADLALVYHHPRQPVQLDPSRYQMLQLGSEAIYPYARCDAAGQPLLRLPGAPGQPVPFLAYAPNAYLKRMVDLIVDGMQPRPLLHTRCETDMAEGLKAMVLEGHGVAFLPESAVRRELRQRQLACAGAEYSMRMDIRLYRERGRSRKDAVEALWESLSARVGAPA